MLLQFTESILLFLMSSLLELLAHTFSLLVFECLTGFPPAKTYCFHLCKASKHFSTIATESLPTENGCGHDRKRYPFFLKLKSKRYKLFIPFRTMDVCTNFKRNPKLTSLFVKLTSPTLQVYIVWHLQHCAVRLVSITACAHAFCICFGFWGESETHYSPCLHFHFIMCFGHCTKVNY